MSEADIQKAIVAWLRAVLRPGHHVIHIYNNPRSKIAGAIAKSMGLTKGAPDLALIRPLGRVAFIEVKKESGRMSPEQKQFQQYCREWGVPYGVCRSVGDVSTFLQDIGVETKEAA